VTPNEIETWLWQARDSVINTLDFKPIWWPKTQGEASALAAAFFLTATRARLGGPDRRLSVSAAWQKNKKRRRVVQALWGDGADVLSPSEVLLDFTVHDWEAHVFCVSGESEVGSTHGVGDSLTTADDYSWDFFKLLAVRSPFRLFVARVGTRHREDTVAARIATLEASLTRIVTWCGGQLLAPEDQLGVLLLAASKEAATSSRLLHLQDGALVGTTPQRFPPLWKRDLPRRNGG
jgi:hypothetical protein